MAASGSGERRDARAREREKIWLCFEMDFASAMNLLAVVLRVGLIIGALAAIGASVQAAEIKGTWHTADGSQFDGRLAEVLGTHAVVVGKKTNAILPIEAFTDEELQRVAAFLSAKPTQPLWGNSASKVTQALLPRLEMLNEGKLASYDPAARPEPELYLVYFSAGWCGPCHRFTPSLIEAYQRWRATMPGRVEVIFVSNDRSASEQSGYAREAGMPWPMLKYSQLGRAKVIERWAGNGIPCLVAVTRDGDVLFHSYRGEEYLGPKHVMNASDQLLQIMAGKSAAGRRSLHRLAVIQHVAAAGTGDNSPKPYLIALDRPKYGAIEIPPLTFQLKVDERGRVTEASIAEPVGNDLQRLLKDDAANWLFLPAVEAGKPTTRTVQVPLQLGAKKA